LTALLPPHQVNFGVKAGYDSKLPIVSWQSAHFFINMTNLLALCCKLPRGQLAKDNGEMSVLGRLNPALSLEELHDIHGQAWLPVL
jgi:hypothetical protein